MYNRFDKSGNLRQIIDSSQAKSDGTTISQHVNHLLDEMNILSPFLFKKAESIIGIEEKKIRSILECSIMFHDDGKAHPKWQSDMLNGQLIQGNVRHEIISALIHFSDELRSINDLEDDDGALDISKLSHAQIAAIAILYHHGKFKEDRAKKTEENSKNYNKWELKYNPTKLYNLFKNKVYNGHMNSIKIGAKEYAVESEYYKHYYFINLIRSLLQVCDKNASVNEELKDIVRFDEKIWKNWKSQFNSKTSIQKMVENSSTNLLFKVVKAPPGGGKTYAFIMEAKRLIDAGMADRMVVLQPTKFVSNAMYAGLLKDKGLVDGIGHSHSGSKLNLLKGEKDIFRLKRLSYLNTITSQFGLPLNISTIDQCLLSLVNKREEQRIRFMNLVHSFVVIDEFDAYNEYTRENLISLMNILYKYKVPIMVVSASISRSMIDFISQTSYGRPELIVDDHQRDEVKTLFSKRDIVEYNIHGSDVQEQEDLIKLFKSCFELNDNGSIKNRRIIVFANTVKRCLIYSDAIEKISLSMRLNDRLNLISYHSYFTSTDRLEKESLIDKFFGESSLEVDNEMFNILVITQIGEISVNITSDMMITDVCPMDRLYQRLGRLKRFISEKGSIGQLKIIMLYGKNSFLPYVKGSQDNDEASEFFNRTMDILKSWQGYRLTHGDIDEMVERVYDRLPDVAPAVKKNADDIYKMFTHFPIMPKVKMSNEPGEDIEEEDDFLTRGPINNKDLFVRISSKKFDTFFSFNEEKEKNSISVQSWQVDDKGLKSLIKRGIAEKAEIEVGDEKNEVFILKDAHKSRYNIKNGLSRILHSI